MSFFKPVNDDELLLDGFFNGEISGCTSEEELD
jgi:hypothetical protein